jgi:diguanylate cyclase (GGDEF)-like protein
MNTTARILVVDDDPTNLALLSRTLGKAGYEVLTATDGVSALDAANEHLPDVILLDVMMPEMDGLQVSSILRSHEATAPIPILFVTAQTDSDRIIDAFERGGVDYITKPFRVDEILARVSVHVRLRLAERELERRNVQLEVLAKKLEQMNLQLARQARQDSLTRLLNRGAWEESARLEHARSARHGEEYGILMLDIDDFKALNDDQGHQQGDECLRRTAECISSACRPFDLVGRYGGEEFVILAPHTDEEGIRCLAERMRSTVWDLALPHPSNRAADRVTVSVGTARCGADGALESIIRAADQALYKAKAAGRNCVRSAADGSTTHRRPAHPGTPAAECPGDDSPGVVLVVDDDPMIRSLCTRILAHRGYRVHEACDGLEALAVAEHRQPDVILMDVAMPRLDGLEAVRRLKASTLTHDIPVVMISAHTDMDEVDAALDAGADGYLTKPIVRRELEVRVRTMTRLCRRYRQLLRACKAKAEARMRRAELAKRSHVEAELRG